jgi:hypothetical protein
VRALRALASDNHAIGQEAAGRSGARPSAGVARAYRRPGSADLHHRETVGANARGLPWRRAGPTQ